MSNSTTRSLNLAQNNLHNNRPNPTFVQHANIPSYPQLAQYPELVPSPQDSQSEFAPTTSAPGGPWNVGRRDFGQPPLSDHPQATRCFSSQVASYSNNPAPISSGLEPLPYPWDSHVIVDAPSGVAPVTQGNEFSQGLLGFNEYGQLQYDVATTPYTSFQTNPFTPPNQ